MIEIRVNGETFEEYKSVRVQRSLNNTAGASTLELSPTQIDKVTGERKGKPIPVRVNDLIQILVDGESKLFGHVDKLNGSYDPESHDLTYTIRDNTQDLIDSSVPPGAKNIERTQTLKQFAETVILALGAIIPVTDTIGTLKPIISTTGTISAGSSSNCIEYLTSYARKVQAYYIPDGKGGLEIFRPSGKSNGNKLINRIGSDVTNIKSANFTIDHSKRFRKYVCKSQANFAYDPTATAATGTNITGSVTDTEIRASRYLEIKGEQALSAPETKARVEEEANLRRASSAQYSCTVQGFKGTAGIVYDIGQSNTIDDDFAQKKGVFTIVDVVYSYDNDGGSLTELTYSDPDAFKVVPILTDTDAVRSGQNTKTITKANGYEDNDFINRGMSGSINDTFNEVVGE
jgi:prophage tail gpP-like protein